MDPPSLRRVILPAAMLAFGTLALLGALIGWGRRIALVLDALAGIAAADR